MRADLDDDNGSPTLAISRSSGTINVSLRGRMGPSDADFVLTVPTWMPLALHAVDGNITVRGTSAAISAESVSGNVSVTGGTGTVSLSSVSGTVELSQASGNIRVSAVNDDITVSNSTGSVSATSVNGSVWLDGVNSSAVSLESVNGDVRFGGPVQNGGRYQLNTHNGDVSIGVQPGAGATVSVSTFNGDFSSDIPVQLSARKRGERSFTFVLGDGSARLDLQSFQGSIQITRPGKGRGR